MMVSLCASAYYGGVLQHLTDKRHLKLIQFSDAELADAVTPYAEALGGYFQSLTPSGRAEFRAGARGNQGQTATRHRCEKAIHDVFPEFVPPGMLEALKLQEAGTNEEAYRVIRRIELALQSFIMDTLKLEFCKPGGDPEAWWYNGIPEPIRKKATARVEEEQGKGRKDEYLDLIDYRTIVLNNWPLFQDSLGFGFGKSGNKQAKTDWMQRLNEMRKVVMHPTKGKVVTFEQLAQLREYEQLLNSALKVADTGTSEDDVAAKA